MRAEVLPYTETFIFDEEPNTRGERVEFRLVYKGPLPAESSKGVSRTKYKHLIRKEFHRQLGELWKQTPALRWQLTDPVHVFRTPGNMVSYPGPGKLQVHPLPPHSSDKSTFVDYVGRNYERAGYQFVPLIRKEYGVACTLDILFLRRDNPGYPLIRSGGDLDNRIKVLFDAFRLPSNLDECGGMGPAEGETPFFCLLEDDDLITGVHVTTDRLLVPLASDEHVHDVDLVIKVSTTVHRR